LKSRTQKGNEIDLRKFWENYSDGLGWEDEPADGLGAMAGAWWCGKEAETRGVSMGSLGLMQEIEAYNEVDCKAMAEILTYLRNNH